MCLAKFKFNIGLFLFLLLPVIIEAQSEVDSMRTLLTQAPSDSAYIELLNKLSKACRWSDPAMALDYAVKAEKISEADNNQNGLAWAYHNIGAIYADKNNNELALEYYLKSLKINEILQNKSGIANVEDNIGLIYRRQGNYEMALEYHNKSLKLKTELGDTIGIAYSYGNMGLVYADQGKYDKALIQFYNSLRIKETQNDKYGMANSYGNIGFIYMKIGSIEQARINLERGLELFREIGNKTGIAEALLYLGDIYFKQNESGKAIDAFNQSLVINTEKGDIKGMADATIKIGNIYYTSGKSEAAKEAFSKSLEFYKKIENIKGIVTAKIALARYFVDSQSFYLARLQLNDALKLATEQNLLQEQYDILNLLSGMALKQYLYKEASGYLVKAKSIADSLYNKKLDKEVTQVQMQYDFDKKMQEKTFEERTNQLIQQHKLKRYAFIRNISLGTLIIIMILAFFLYQKTKELSKKNILLITQKNQIFDQLMVLSEQKEQLEKANETKDRFLSIIGHDLRNPFNAINSFISLLSSHPDEMDASFIQKYVLLIKDAGASAQNLLENLLEWALNQSGELKLELEAVSLNYILRGNVLLVKEIALQKEIEIIENLSENPTVLIDKNMINTVIRNLISNAVKYTPSGGRIELITEIVEDKVKVVVHDNGIGITSDQLLTLFAPGTIKKGKDGTGSSGLGLILCKEFLTKHGEELRVESRVNEGTTFWFNLPLVLNK